MDMDDQLNALQLELDMMDDQLDSLQLDDVSQLEDLDHECDFDLDMFPSMNHVPSWEEHVVKALHLVRLHQITQEDPMFGIPVLTRFYKLNLAYFDFDKESSSAIRGPPILSLRDRNELATSVNVVSLKILKSDMGYPISVFGTVIVRDQVDYKCIYMFNRGKDNPQVISSPKDMLALTDPCRGLGITEGLFFEINLKVLNKVDGDGTDFSKGLIEREQLVVTSDRKLKTLPLTSWHSTLQLAYRAVPSAVAATIAINVSGGALPRDVFTGEVHAWTSGDRNRIVLYNSRIAGTRTEIGDDGSVPLSRCLVAVPVNEQLMLRICIREGEGREGGGGGRRTKEAACFELALNHWDDDMICCRGPYELRLKIEWTAILHAGQEGVFMQVGQRLLIL